MSQKTKKSQIPTLSQGDEIKVRKKSQPLGLEKFHEISIVL